MSQRESSSSLTKRSCLRWGGLALAGALSSLSGCLTSLEQTNDAPVTPSSPTPSPTPTETDTPTATSTPTPTSASTSPLTPTSTATAADVSASTQSVKKIEFDPSQLLTYTNGKYGYRVKYPRGWTINDNNPQNVEIRSTRGFGQLHLSVFKSSQQHTLEETVSTIIQNSRANIATFTVLNQQDVTLANGKPAHIINWRYGDSDNRGGLFRAKYLVTVVGMTIYQVEFGVLQRNYTETVDQAATRILESFTLSG